jgi:hypothetical protein
VSSELSSPLPNPLQQILVLPAHPDSVDYAQEVPANVCALIPMDLLARVVPAAKIEGVTARPADTASVQKIVNDLYSQTL